MRRQILRELGGQSGQSLGLFGQILLTLLEFRDIGIYADGAAVVGAALADHHPASIAPLLNLWLTRITVLLQAFRDPFLDTPFGILDVSPLGSPADNGFERRPSLQFDVEAGIEQVSITRVADDKLVLAVVAGEALGNAFDCLSQSPFASQPGLLGTS